MVGMAHNLNIAVSRGPFRAQGLQRVLGVLRVASDSSLDLAVDVDVDLDAGFGFSLEDLVQSPFLVITRVAALRRFNQ